MISPWLPGPGAPLDELVRNLHRQVEQEGEGAAVSVELADGTLFHLISITAEPGFGFVTLRPHPEDGEARAVIVPVGSIAQIRIGPEEPPHRLGFRLPDRTSS
ncbi:MAG: hypothetical protein H0V84_00910 [Actinobacteria bacterium]|nr:hypothetical protein [Actinomycetota bacterium]